MPRESAEKRRLAGPDCGQSPPRLPYHFHMKLLYQTHSPYARKALVFAHEAGLASRLEVVHHETSPTRRNDEVFAENPLGKVPVLVRPGMPSLFDSDVICAWLDTQHEGLPLIPPEGEARWQALRVQAVAQGLADAGIAHRWETVRRPEAFRYPPLQEGYAQKLLSSYDWLERELDVDSAVHVGHIALATTLSWLEFRELPSFGPGRPRLAGWQEAFERRPSMRATPLSGETQD
jgi:glutathione S-transferase